MKELVEKIETAGGVLANPKAKVLELLEKQTRLLEESINTDREFLSIFKVIVNSMTRDC